MKIKKICKCLGHPERVTISSKQRHDQIVQSCVGNQLVIAIISLSHLIQHGLFTLQPVSFLGQKV